MTPHLVKNMNSKLIYIFLLFFNSTSRCFLSLLSYFSALLSPTAVSQPHWLLSPLSPGPLALILGSGSWQPHPLSYRLACTQCPRSSFTNTMHSPAVHLPLSLTLSPHPSCPFAHFSFPFVHSLRSFHFLKLSSNPISCRCDSAVSGNSEVTGEPTTETVSCLISAQGSMSGTSQSSQSHCRAKQRLCAPSFKPRPLRQLPPPRSHWQTARKTDGLCIHDQFSGSPGVTPIQGEGFCQPFYNKAFQSGRKLEMHFKIVP